MTYCRAVVHEVLRHATNVAVGIAHTCVKDEVLEGMRIPKGALVIANQYAINHDPKEFAEPELFKPERFIRPEDGSFNQEVSEKMVSFSNGKRRCPGEQFAKSNLFLFLIYICGRLNVRLDHTSFDKNPLHGGPPAFTFMAGPHKLIFTKRL